MSEIKIKLTPYQGKRRSFGKFKCSKCENEWSSGNSWANMGQQYKMCFVNIYPKKQYPLKRRKAKDGDKPHLEPLCEKCEDIEENCATWREPKLPHE